MAILTLDQARAFAQAAGFSGPSLSIVLAIAQAESGLNTQATNGPGDNTPPSIDRGVLQLNSFWHAEVPDACAFDPACAFTAAWTISGGGTHWPWSTYSNGAYLKYMPPAGAPPMADTITGGVVKRETEFIETQPGNPNSRIFATCGPDALASVASAALNQWLTCLTVYQAMRNRSLCDPNGASTLSRLHAACDIWGLTHVAFHDYDLGWHSGTWRADVVAQAKAGNPFVLMLHNGQQLADLISGQGENGSGIANHFIAGLGYHPGGVSDAPWAHGKTLPEGLWCADGASYAGGNNRNNNFNAANVLQFYPLDNVQAAWPCGFVVVAGHGEALKPMAWTQQADGSGKDAKGNTCGAGSYNALVAAGFAAFDGRMSEAHYPAAGVADVAFLPLTNGATIHAVQQTAGGVWTQDTNGSQVAVDLYEAWQAGVAQIAALNAKIAALEAAAPPVQPPAPQPPVSPPAPTDPLATEALAVLTAQKAFFAKLP